jgi:hypothetical protein
VKARKGKLHLGLHPRPREEPGSLRHDRRCIPEALSSRSPPRRAAPAPRSAPHAWPPGADQAPGIRHAVPAASLNEIRASKTSLATRIKPGHRGPELAAERPAETEVDNTFASWPRDREGRRVRFAGETRWAEEHDTASRPGAPSHLRSNGCRGRPERVKFFRYASWASRAPTLPRVRGPRSTTRELTRDSWTRAPPCDRMLAM